jgi:hypothetical protein
MMILSEKNRARVVIIVALLSVQGSQPINHLVTPASCYSNRWVYTRKALWVWWAAVTKVMIIAVRHPVATPVRT